MQDAHRTCFDGVHIPTISWSSEHRWYCHEQPIISSLLQIAAAGLAWFGVANQTKIAETKRSDLMNAAEKEQ